MTDEGKPGEAGTWERGFEGHELAQLARLAALPLREKLRWLEEAHRMVRHLRGASDQHGRSG